MATSAEILTQHKERISQLYSETKSWQKVFERLSSELPNPIGMQLPTFKQYAPIMLELMKELNKSELNNQLNNTVKQEFEQVKQELNNQIELNNRLNKEIELNNPVKQELEQVKQQLNTLQELNNELNNRLNNQLNNPELNNPVKQSVKQGLNISGWTIHKSGEYHRAFKKVSGKMLAVYVGKNLSDAEQKIQAKEQQLNSESHSNTATDT